MTTGPPMPNSSGSRRAAAIAAVALAILLPTLAAAQTVTIVGTRHLTGLEPPPNAAQLAHTVDRLTAYAPTQVCVERMGGARIQGLVGDMERNGFTVHPDTHHRPVVTRILPAGLALQAQLRVRPEDARDRAAALAARGPGLDDGERIRLLGLQVAGYELHSAVLNWSYLDGEAREAARGTLPDPVPGWLDELLASPHEVYSLGVPLARRAGLNELCAVDSLEDDSRGMLAMLERGGSARLDQPEARARFERLSQRWEEVWEPGSGPGALTRMLAYFNSDEFADDDRTLQWETMRELDTEEGVVHRRLMLWHARTAEISAELYRALARGPRERVLLIIGSAHRPFSEAELRSQPWLEVVPAIRYLQEEGGEGGRQEGAEPEEPAG